MEQLRELALSDGWRKLVVDGVTATPVSLRRGPAVKVVDGARTETVPREEWPARLDALLDPARNVHLLAPDGDLHARRTKKGLGSSRAASPRRTQWPTSDHDRARVHPLPADHPLFRATKIGRDKERQVQHYIELLRTLPIWERERIRVVDAGCGKAYMSLALVAYGRELGTRVELVGLDANPQVIETVQAIAEVLGYDEARFEATAIVDYESVEPIDLLVAARVRHGNRRGDRRGRTTRRRRDRRRAMLPPRARRPDRARDKNALLRHGLLLGRQADLVTDALRAAALETLGYRVDVIEFVSAEHTAKNVMLRAERAPSEGAGGTGSGRVRGAA